LRWRKYGDPSVVKVAAGPDSGTWRGDAIRYAAAHVRVRTARGSASAHACHHCARPAKDWAYDHGDPDEKWGRHGNCVMRYSTDPDHYIPLCRKCHKAFDDASRALGNHSNTGRA
jgi:hypothetical protein